VTILAQDGKHVIGLVRHGDMKLLEFFSKNTETEAEDQTDNDVKKDVMAFILDDDDVFKTHMIPLIQKIESGKKIKEKDYNDMVKDCCIRFYKEKNMTTDPNEIFPKEMRQQIAKELHSINKNHAEKMK
jgi:uncharacterized protein YihD (DUF1040 family)